MSHGVIIVLLFLTGFIMAFVVMIASSGLSAYYLFETVRRVVRSSRRPRKP